MSQTPIDTDEGVQQILSEVGRKCCALESFRDGRMIDGYACRLTLGRLALMGLAECRIFSDDDKEGLTEYDVLKAWWFTIEENIDSAVYMADDKEALDKEIEKLVKHRTPHRRAEITDEVEAWLVDISESIPQSGGDSDGCVMRADWWVDAVDCIASQYNWNEEFILWYLPLVRAIKYQEKICARINGESVSDDISNDITVALDKIEEMKKDG